MPSISCIRHTNTRGDNHSTLASLRHWGVHHDLFWGTLWGQKGHFWAVICDPALLWPVCMGHTWLFERSLNETYLFLWSLKGYRLHWAAEDLSCHVVWIKTQLLNLHGFSNLSETLLALMEQVDMTSDAKDLLVISTVAPLWDACWATEICHRLICLGCQGSQSWSLDVWIFCADNSLLSFDECIKSWQMSGVFD